VVGDLTLSGGYDPADGGGVDVNGASPTFRDCRFTAHRADHYGGALFIDGRGAPTFLRCVFENSSAGWRSSAVEVWSGSPIFTECVFRQNHCDGSAGVFETKAGFPPELTTFQSCRFDTNDATYGIGVGAIAGTTNFTQCAFVGNYGPSQAGAIQMDGGTGTFTDCLFWRNVTDGVGSAVYAGLSPAAFDQCTFAANTAGPGSATIQATNSFSHVTLTNCILYGDLVGQAAACSNYATLTASCSDVYGNAGGDYVGCLAPYAGVNGNISADPLFCDEANGDFGLGSGSPCLPENTGCGPMGATSWGTNCALVAVTAAGAAPAGVTLAPGRPNPYNPSTTVEFTLPEAGRVAVRIFDVMGRRVRVLADAVLGPGAHAIEWDGRNEMGLEAASGTYFVELTALGRREVRKLVLAR